MRALLDVNVLIALLDADHEHHNAARQWLQGNDRHGWATCPITENGCVRIMSQPRYPSALPASDVAERLLEATRSHRHEFWPDAHSILDRSVVAWPQVQGPKQVTDTYLLALAVQRGGCFATFDSRIDIGTVVGATNEHLRHVA